MGLLSICSQMDNLRLSTDRPYPPKNNNNSNNITIIMRTKLNITMLYKRSY